MRSREYVLIDQKTGGVLARFDCDKALFMGGSLKVHEMCGLGAQGLDLKVLMAFLALNETKRRISHCTVYKPSEGNSNRLNRLCYRPAEFLLRSKSAGA